MLLLIITDYPKILNIFQWTYRTNKKIFNILNKQLHNMLEFSKHPPILLYYCQNPSGDNSLKIK